MPGRSESELQQMYPDETFRSKFADLYALRRFFFGAIDAEPYRIPESVTNGIPLTIEGDRVFEHIKQTHTNVTDEDARFAVFLLLAHHDLFVDVLTVNTEPIVAFLSKCIADGNVQYPYLYGRTLYDKAYDTLRPSPRRLDRDETMQLLLDTPVTCPPSLVQG